MDKEIEANPSMLEEFARIEKEMQKEEADRIMKVNTNKKRILNLDLYYCFLLSSSSYS